MTEPVRKSKLTWIEVFRLLLIASLMWSCSSRQTVQAPPVEPTAAAKPHLTPLPFKATPTLTNTPEIREIILDKSTSPKGDWTAAVSLTVQDTQKSLVFSVSNNFREQRWVAEQMEWDELKTSTSWVPFPYIFKWADDNQSLFYSYEPNSNDGCFGYFRPGGYGLKQLDLANGHIFVVREGNATWMALSPSERQLAYIDDFGGNVSILEIKTGRERKYELPRIKNEQRYLTTTSNIYWSPDGKSLIYARYVGACDLPVPYSNIIRLFPETGQQKILVDNSEKGYIPQAWSAKDEILLQDSEGNHWRLNPGTKAITPEQQ
jgi:hypothetical protein